jgi:hypothetical protein
VMLKLTYEFLTTWFGTAVLLVLLFNEKEWDATRVSHHTLAVVLFMYFWYIGKSLKDGKRDK